MKILLISDEESKKFWDYYTPGMLDDYELILSCGDLSPDYLQFLVTMSHASVLYVHGNHDAKYIKNPPLGCISVDDRLFVYQGIRILGLGGSMEYTGGPFQYTERCMKRRIRRLYPKILKEKGFDILLAHAPAFGINDGEDLCHKGFPQFLQLMDRWHPLYFVHGHMHKSYGNFRRLDRYAETTVVNACGIYELDYPDALLDRSRNTRKKKWASAD